MERITFIRLHSLKLFRAPLRSNNCTNQAEPRALHYAIRKLCCIAYVGSRDHPSSIQSMLAQKQDHQLTDNDDEICDDNGNDGRRRQQPERIDGLLLHGALRRRDFAAEQREM